MARAKYTKPTKRSFNAWLLDQVWKNENVRHDPELPLDPSVKISAELLLLWNDVPVGIVNLKRLVRDRVKDPEKVLKLLDKAHSIYCREELGHDV